MAHFNRTFISVALGVAFGFGTLNAYAHDLKNPHDIIGLTDEIMNQYTGKGVKVGVLDGGFFINHPLANSKQQRPLAFDVTDAKGEAWSHNATHYSLDEFNYDITGITKKYYATHGGQVAGIIGAESLVQDELNYKGGIAQQAEVYLASADPTIKPKAKQQDDDTPSEQFQSLLLDDDEEAIHTRKALAIGLDKLSDNQLLAINNSWNEDPFSENVAEIDAKYKDTITTATDNELINAIKKTVEKDTLLVFAAGNESKTQTGVMASLPRFLPSLEKHYLSVVSIDDNHQLEDYSNHCGVSKNWCVSAPGSLTVLMVDGYEDDVEEFDLTTEQGTSYAAPVVTGSLALIQERFSYFKPTQVRDTLLTTATDLGDVGVDDTFGWGVVNLQKAIKGPSQLLNDETFYVTQNDTWQNDLTSEHTFTKSGIGELILSGQNHLHKIHAHEGKLTLAGKTSAHQVHNQAHLAVAELAINQSFASDDMATLELIAPQGIHATGETTVVRLAGTLLASDELLADKKAGDITATVLTLSDGANHQGGFHQLQQNTNLSNQGLRQDVYFNQDGISLMVNTDTPFTDESSQNANAKHGLAVLNQLRDTPTAWQAGTYNTWLQQAVNGNLNGLHHQVINTLYADNIELLRSYNARQLHQKTTHLWQHEHLATKQPVVWLSQNREKYQIDTDNSYVVRDFKLDETQLNLASKLNDNMAILGTWTQWQAKSDHSASHSNTKQNQLGVSLYYAPRQTNWFVDISGQYGKADYEQQRYFNDNLLGMAKNHISTFGIQTQAGYKFNIGDWQLRPSIGVQTLRFNMKALAEHGDMAITTPSFHQTDVNLVTALQANRTFMVNGWQIMPQISLDYIQRFNDDKTQIQGQLANLTINNEANANNRRQLETGLMVNVGKNRWFGSLGLKHHLFNHGNATQARLGIGAKF